MGAHLLITNNLGKNTTVTEIRIEREEGEPIPVTQQKPLIDGDAYRIHHIFDLGENQTSITGKLVVEHAQGKPVIVPLNESFDLPIENMSHGGIEVLSGRRPR